MGRAEELGLRSPGTAVRECASARGKVLTSQNNRTYSYIMQVHFPEDLQEKIDRAAAAQGRDSESIVREAVERSLNYDQWLLREVETGLAAAERGDFVDHDEVKKLIEGRYR